MNASIYLKLSELNNSWCNNISQINVIKCSFANTFFQPSEKKKKKKKKHKLVFWSYPVLF